MKVSNLVIAGASLLALLAGPLAAAPLNFKVQTLVDSREESLDRPRTYFTVGTKKMCFTTPATCDLSSGAEGISLYLNKSHVNGQVTVIGSAFKPDLDLYANVDEYVRVAKTGIPTEAEDVEFKGGSDHVYVINKWKSNALEWTYKLRGRQIRRQVAFINVDAETQICLTVVCDEESAPVALGAARGFVNSWFWGEAFK